MTSGVKEFGDPNEAYWYSKSWSGANSKHKGVIPTPWNAYSSNIRHNFKTPGEPDWWLPTIVDFYGENPWKANDEIDLMNKLAGATNGHEFNLAVTGSQGKQTVDLVVATTRRFFEAFKQLKRGRIDLAARSLGVAPPRKGGRLSRRGLVTKDVSSLWLEIQYGWNPMLQDIHGAMTAFAAIADRPRISQYKVSGSATGDYSAVFKSGGFRIGWLNQEMKVSRQIIAELSEPASTGRGLGLMNPASVVWELTPFSFVADWFLPIGDYLAALQTIPNLEGRFLVTEKSVVQTDFEGREMDNYLSSTFYVGARNLGKYVVFSRSPLGSLYVPLPNFVPPSKAMSAGRIANAVSLLHQFTK